MKSKFAVVKSRSGQPRLLAHDGSDEPEVAVRRRADARAVRLRVEVDDVRADGRMNRDGDAGLIRRVQE
jgi:hypothetical protein